MVADPTHRHDEFHRGSVPQNQLASNSPVSTYVLTATSSTGTDFAHWEPGGGGGGSLTVEQTGGTPATGSVTIIEVGNYTDNGGGDVTLFPGIIGTGAGQVDFGSTYTAIYDPSNNNDVSVGADYVNAYATHTPGSLTDNGINLQAGSDAIGWYLSELNSTTVEIYPDQANHHAIVLTDRGSAGTWKTSGAGGTWKLQDLHLTKLAGQAIAITQTTIAHGLGATPSVVIITPRGVSFAYESANADSSNVYVTAAGATTVDIYVAI